MKFIRKVQLLKFLFKIMGQDPLNQEKLFELLGHMKGVPQKYGQFLYMKDKDTYSSFEKLLDHGIPYHEKLFRMALDLTHGIDMDPMPLASASIGQVYGGKIGLDEVIVKIQYPKVKDELKHDWKFLKKMVGFFFTFFRFPQESKDFLGDYIQELEETVDNETDYSTEGDNLLLFRNIFEGFNEIFIPRLYGEYTGSNIIVEERCMGTPLGHFLKTSGEDGKRRVLHHLLFFYFHSFFNHGILHGDPHSGNFFVSGDQLQVVDFGCVKHYDGSFVEDIKNLILCLRHGDDEKIHDLLIRLGFEADQISSYGHALVPILNVIFEPFLVDGDFDFNYWKMTYKLNTIMGSKVFERTLSLPNDLLILFRVFHGFISHVYTLEEKTFNVYQFIEE